MWGEGYFRPAGSAFERQFEPMGKPKQNGPFCRCYHYRPKLQGSGVVVSREEYDKICSTMYDYVLRRNFLTVIVYLIFSGPFFLLEAVFDFGDWAGRSLLVGFVPAIIYCIRQRTRDWQRIHDSLAGRRKVGRDRSPEEARILWFALSDWNPICWCAVIVVIPIWMLLENAIYPQPHDWIWIGPLGAVIVFVFGRWILLKARARRYVDRNWRRGRPDELDGLP
jgi:hypothetical protein